MIRLFCICGVLLLVFGGAAFGEGTYQRTKDGKTIVWNDDPKPGDTAAWFGDRDADGYATKVGTLSWYTANGAVYARYFGNMVRGKFDGMVNFHSKGKTDHAIFVDGQRTTRWATGRAPSFRAAEQRPRPVKTTVKIAKAESAELRKHLQAGSPTPKAFARHGGQASRQPNSESLRPPRWAGEQAVQRPMEETPAEGSPTVREAENVQGPIEDAAAKELSQQQAPPVTPAATAEPPSAGDGLQRGEPEAPAEGPRIAQSETALATTSSSPGEQPPMLNSKSFGEQETQPAFALDPESVRGRSERPMEDRASVLIQPEESVPKPRTNKKSKAESADFLQSPGQPPSSLYAIPETAVSPEASQRLTKEQVIKIANAEARKRGYNRADYHRAEAQYNAAYKIWSVSYERSTVDGMDEAGKHFSVIVDDKTKGAVFELRR